MKTLFTSYFSKRFLPKWIILFFDLSVVVITFMVAFILRFNFSISQALIYFEPCQLLLIIPPFLISFYITKTYAGIIRHSTTKDIAIIVFSLSLGGFGLLILSDIARFFGPSFFPGIPLSVLVIQFTLSSLTLLTSRLLIKGLYTEWFVNRKDVKHILIFGAGRLGQITRNALMVDDKLQIKIVGFIDDNVTLQNKHVAGFPIYSTTDAFEKIVSKKNVTELIFAIEKKKLPLRRKREIVALCQEHNLKIKEVPMINNWIDDSFKAREIRDIKIEDLLGRDSIELDTTKIKEGLKNATILITGAAGSIGSEIVRQLLSFNASNVVLLDKAESDLYDLHNELISKFSNPEVTVIVGDVTNEAKLRKIFQKYKPSMVINAAAYKHVPLMENFPCEAIRVNIGGTRLLADLSVEFGVKKFVMVSTDKAVNPTNVMGASKRISEIYIQALSQSHTNGTQFITTRFGNVLGSNGSVVPLFKKQIESGGPVTVTHQDITRFFMTIPEACQLVLEASFLGKGGEIFVFDMGEPVKIYDLAEKMIYLSGLTPHKDIKIEITQLRPGEKLFEEVLGSQEDLLPTHNEKIMIGKNVFHDYDLVSQQINRLVSCADELENQVLVNYMREIAPEFVSQNSFYSNESHQKKKIQIPA
jgi:FlaA1/EpsC-like NDP-sugar epimerase